MERIQTGQKLQCPLERIQNKQKGKQTCAENHFGLPGGLPFKAAESVEPWQCQVPSSQAGTSSVSTTCSGNVGYPLSLRWRQRACRKGVDPLTCLAGEMRCHLPINVSADKEIQMRAAKFWPVILAFFPESPAFTNAEHL